MPLSGSLPLRHIVTNKQTAGLEPGKSRHIPSSRGVRIGFRWLAVEPILVDRYPLLDTPPLRSPK